MFTEPLEFAPPDRAEEDWAPHVLVVVADAKTRNAVVSQLGGTDWRVSTAPAYGLVEVLRARADRFDLLVTTQSAGEMACFGLPQLARSVVSDLPIVVLDSDAVRGHGVVAAAEVTMVRWPVRDRPARRLH